MIACVFLNSNSSRPLRKARLWLFVLLWYNSVDIIVHQNSGVEQMGSSWCCIYSLSFFLFVSSTTQFSRDYSEFLAVVVSPFTMVVRGGASPCYRPRRSANAPPFPLAFALVSLTTTASFACYHIHQCSQWGSFNAHQVFDASPSLYDVSDVTLEDVGLLLGGVGHLFGCMPYCGVIPSRN
jgi:hypothetical protein